VLWAYLHAFMDSGDLKWSHCNRGITQSMTTIDGYAGVQALIEQASMRWKKEDSGRCYLTNTQLPAPHAQTRLVDPPVVLT